MSARKTSKRKRRDDEDVVTVSKQSLDEAVALIYENEEEIKARKKFTLTKNKLQRECWMSNFKAQKLKSVAEIYSPENLQTELLEELRVSLLENNFSASAKILNIILNSGTKTILPIIWKTAVVLFLNHNPASYECLEEFLEMCVDQRSQEDKRNFIKKLISLPDLLVERSRNGKKKSETIDVVLSEDEIIFS